MKHFCISTFTHRTEKTKTTFIIFFDDILFLGLARSKKENKKHRALLCTNEPYMRCFGIIFHFFSFSLSHLVFFFWLAQFEDSRF